MRSVSTLEFLIAVCVVAVLAAPASATVITFDEFAFSFLEAGQAIPDGYQGFDWNDDSLMIDPDFFLRGTGYYNGRVSGENVAYTGSANPFGMSDGLFTFDSAYFTAAWRNDVSVRVQGFLGPAELFAQTIVADFSGPTFYAFNWSGIDNLIITPIDSGTVVPGLRGSGAHIVIDDLSVNAVPEPSSLLLLGTGGISLIAKMRRRRKHRQRLH